MFDSVAVMGAGVMGTGIAKHLAQTENHVFLFDVNQDQLAAAKAAVGDLPVTCTSDFASLVNVEYVIEAVFEDLQVKRNLLAELSRRCSRTCIIASNTSSLLISDLATAVTDPERFIGVHYNNPADLNPVVEIIPADSTTPEISSRILDWMVSTGKMAVRCADTSGFILNRQSLPYINEAARCLDVARPAQIDQVATGELGVGLGPFAVMNLVGLKVMAASSENLSTLGNGYLPADTLKQQASEDHPVWTIGADGATGQGLGSEISTEIRTEIKDRLLGAMIFPGKDILDQALCSRDDLHMICIEALGYNRSSPELLEQLDPAEVTRLTSRYLEKQSGA